MDAAPTRTRTAARADPYAAYVPRMLFGVPPRPSWWSVEGSLVFADVSGFTRLSERLAKQGRIGAEELVSTISGVFTSLLSATDDGGDVLKFGGDALLILFRGDRHAHRACHAARGMQRALQDAGRIVSAHGRIRLRMSVGIHSGTFPFFLVGRDHLELVVTGQEATRTVDLESAAEAGDILVSDVTAASLPGSALHDRKGPGVLVRRVPALPGLETAGLVEGSPEADLERYIPLPLRGRLGPESEEHEHRQVTVSFIHFAGVDRLLATQGPSEVFDRLQALAEAVDGAASDHGVTILTTDIGPDGGKYYLAAGAPDASDDDEGRMLHVCRRIVDADVGLQLRAGVNRGHVFGGDVGAPFRRTYSVMGDTVNLAARIMGKAPFGAVLAHRSVVERSRSRFAVEAVPPFAVKGKSAPVDAAVVGAPRPGADQPPRVWDTPLIGRDRELAALLAAVDAACTGAGSAVEISGDAGVGKSRLVAELLRHRADVASLRVACDPTEQSLPYSAARLFLRKALGIQLGADEVEAGRSLLERIASLAPHLVSWAPLVATALGGHLSPTREVEELAPRFRAERLASVVEELLSAALGTTIICIEEASWMDDASADVLAGVLRHIGDHPWAVVLTSRDTDAGLRPSRGFRAWTVPLGPLTDEDTTALAVAVVQRSPIPLADLEAITDRSGGNPLFLIELLAAYRDGQELPASVEAVLAARIDALGPQDRRALRYVSVLGSHFEGRILDRAFIDFPLRSDDAALWRRLEEFIEADGGGGFRFRTGLVREVAYEGLSFALRRDLHRRVAVALEASGATDRVALLSQHYHEARCFDRSLPYAIQAGDEARESYANVLAATHYRRALEAAEHLELPREETLPISERLGDVLELAGLYDQADDAYRRARLAAVQAEDAVRLLRKQGMLRKQQGGYTSALRWYGRGLTAATELDDIAQRRACRGQLHVAYAVVRFRQGKLRAAVRLCRQAIEDASAAGDLESLAYAHFVLNAALLQLDPTAGEDHHRHALALYERLGDLLGQEEVLDNLGVAAYYRGDWAAARDWYERSRDVALRAGNSVGAACSTMNLGEVLCDQGFVAEAIAELRQAQMVMRGSNYPAAELCTTYLGTAEVRSGRPVVGLQLLDEGLTTMQSLGQELYVLEVRLRRAEALLALREAGQALSEVDGALDELPADHNPAQLAMAQRLRAQALHRLGEIDGARRALDESVRIARRAQVTYQLALSLEALAEQTSDADARDEAERLFQRLGVRRPQAPASV